MQFGLQILPKLGYLQKPRGLANKQLAKPLDITLTGLNQGCRSVAFTYNDPIIWAEYALDTARACHDLGLSAMAVTAGYLTDTARSDFFHSSMPPIST